MIDAEQADGARKAQARHLSGSLAKGGRILESRPRPRKRELFLSAHRLFLCALAVPIAPGRGRGRNIVGAGLAQTVKTIYTAACRLKKRRSFARSAAPRPCSTHFERNRTRTPIVNSRNAPRNAQALAGLRAFVCALPLCCERLPMGQALEHRESEDRSPSGRQPRLTTRLPHSEFQRPGFRKGSGPFCFPSTSGVPPHSVVAQRSWCTRRGMCAAGNPASCSETPPPTGGLARGHSRSGSRSHVVFVQLARTSGVSIRVMRVRVPHTTPIKSRERSRSATKPAATIGRLRNPSPEPFVSPGLGSGEIGSIPFGHPQAHRFINRRAIVKHDLEDFGFHDHDDPQAS